MADNIKNPPVTLAVITGAHGVTGEVRVKLFCDELSSLKQHKNYNEGTLTLASCRPHKGGALARFTEIKNRNDAEANRGTELSVPRSDLPEITDEEYYHSDLINLPCISSDGDDLGKCIAVHNFGAGDILEIQRPDKKKFMVPMNEDAIPEWGEQITIAVDFVQ